MSLRKNESGQAVVLTVLSLLAIMGMCALVLDVGSWFRQKRQMQATADASALAGAQALPEAPSTAQTYALKYAKDNNGGDSTIVTAGDVKITTTRVTGDTITVTAKKPPGLNFVKAVPGFNPSSLPNITAGATAIKGSYTGWAKGLAPWVIDKPSVQFGTIISFKVESGDQAAPGNFGGVDLPMKEKGCADSSGGNDYYDMIAQRSHSCLVSINQQVPVEPGNKAATGTAVKDRGAVKPFDPYSLLTTNANGVTEIKDYNSPQVIVIPIIKNFHQGSSQPFTVIGFAWFIITDYTSKTVTGMFVRSGAPQASKCPTASDPNADCPFGAYNPDGFAVVRLIK